MPHPLPLALGTLLGAAVLLAAAPVRDGSPGDFPGYFGELCTSEDATALPAGGLAGLIADRGPLPLQSPAPAPGVAFTTAFDPDSAQIDLTVTPVAGERVVAGQEVRATLTIRDGATGLPVSGQDVAGWMMLQRNAQVSAELPCGAKARLFSQGRVTARPDVDLNAARLFVLNRDGSIAIVNPQVDFTITQMERVIPLPGVPADWAMADDRQTVFVSLPVLGAVAVIDTRAGALAGLIDLPKGSLPTQLLPLPGGALAIYLSATGRVTVARPGGGGQSDPAAIGAGPVAMVRGGPGAMFVASSAGRIVRIDTATGRPVASRGIAAGAPSLAWSPVNRTLYAATATGTAIEAFAGAGLHPKGRIATRPGIFALAMDPAQRHLIALNRETDNLTLIDTESGSIAAETRVADQPVEIAFSHDYAYVRGLGGDHFTLIERAELAAGRLAPIDIQSAAGPLRPREALSRARLIAPYGHGALVGNADEQVAYYYMEGMNSPMGTVKTYGPNVQGLMTVDRGFRETAPGTYETTATLPFGGVYDIPVAVGGSGAFRCFTAAAAAKPAAAPGPDSVDLMAEPEPADLTAKRAGSVVIRITDAATGRPAAGLDVRLLAFTPSGTWQKRKWARDLGGGRYAGDWTFPAPGRYGLSLEVAALGAGFADRPPVYFKVGAPAIAASGGKD